MLHFTPSFILRQFFPRQIRAICNKQSVFDNFSGQKTFSICCRCTLFNAKNIFQTNSIYFSKKFNRLTKISKVDGCAYSTSSSSPEISTDSVDDGISDLKEVALVGDKKLVDVFQQIAGDPIEDRHLSSLECAELRKLSLDALHGDKFTYASAGIDRAIDSRIFKSLLQHSKVLLALSYVEYLSKNDLLNPASIRIAAEILYDGCRLGHVDQSYLLDFLDNVLLKKFDRFVSFAPILLLLCICPTTRWREGIRMLKENSQLKPLASAHYIAAAGCFHNDEPSEGFAVLADFLAKNLNAPPLTDDLHSAIINLIIRKSKINVDDAIDIFMTYVKTMRDSRSLGIPVQFESHVKSIFESSKSNWIIKNAQITPFGICTCCKRQIENDELTSNEFSVMQSNLFDQLLKGEDVCRQTTPYELKQFQKFVNDNKPFDVVLDGLNVAMMGNGRKFSALEKAAKLTNLVRNLKTKLQFENICVIARHHLFYSSPNHLASMLKVAKVFSLNDSTVDDPFILYASLASGKKCFVISRDAFGFLNECFDPYVSSLLQRWKRTKVINQFTEKNSLHVMIKFPPKHRIVCQYADGVFHLPLIRHSQAKLEDGYFMPSSWLCVQKKELP